MIMTPNLFHHIPLIYFKLAKTKKNWKSHHINQNVALLIIFWPFLTLFLSDMVIQL